MKSTRLLSSEVDNSKPNCSPFIIAEQKGLVLVELLLSLSILGILLAGLNGVFTQTVGIWNNNSTSLAVSQDGNFAMERMRQSILTTKLLILPSNDNPDSLPIESQMSVLAVSMNPNWDRDNDGFFDADNDKDGRIDEDPPADSNNDGSAGIAGIDDDLDGTADNTSAANNDEQGSNGDDPVNGKDDDGDGSVDEDFDRDMNNDGQPGISGIDDDGDGSIDEGSIFDDDEDGLTGEDWIDTVVYFLNGTQLMERLPNINPVDGADFSERPIAEGVTSFSVERLSGKRYTTVVLSMTLNSLNNETLNLVQTVRVGSRL